jgi:phage baseplate assembly protein W
MCQATGGLLAGWDHVGQSVVNLFTTTFFSRIMRPYVGSNVIRILGQPANAQTVSRVRTAIAVALDLFEPRLTPYRIDLIDMDRTGTSAWIIQGIYRPRGHLGDPTPAGVRTLTIDPRVIDQIIPMTEAA